MLPVVTEETRRTLETNITSNEESWKKEMVHRIKVENPEINSLLLTLAQDSDDPKLVIKAGYMVYNALEIAQKDEET